MSIALTQCNLLAITSRKADLQYRLMQITATLQKMTAESTSFYEDILADYQHNFKYGNKEDIEAKLDTTGTFEFSFL